MFTLLKVDSEWKNMNKVFHLHPKITPLAVEGTKDGFAQEINRRVDLLFAGDQDHPGGKLHLVSGKVFGGSLLNFVSDLGPFVLRQLL